MNKIKSVYDKPLSENKEGRIKDWAIALNTPFEEMTSEKMEKLRRASRDWEICACGNLCKAIKRHNNGLPKNYILASMGRNFAWSLISAGKYFNRRNKEGFNRSMSNARETHQKIEQRATEILTEMGLLKVTGIL